MAEAFVNTIKRDYVQGADLSDAQTVLRQLPGWIQDYNEYAPPLLPRFSFTKGVPRPAMRRLGCLENRGAEHLEQRLRRAVFTERIGLCHPPA